MINFNEFEHVEKTSWQKEAERLLKGKPLSRLNWEYEPGIALSPYFDKNDLSAENIGVLAREEISNGFRIIEPLYFNDQTNGRSQKALNMGAEGVFIETAHVVKDYSNLSAIMPEYCWFGMKCDVDSLTEIESFFESRDTHKSKFHGFVGTHWIESLDSPNDFKINADKFFETTKTFSEYECINTIEVPLHLFQQRGASITLELGLLLGLLKFIVENAQSQNIAIAQLPKNILISTAVGSDFYHEIAKVRAIRILAYKFFQAYDVPCHPEDFSILGRTSSVVESSLDTDTNYLRKTTQALSIVFGTADALIVTPFEPDGYNEEARRTFRNIGNLIKEETYGHWVSDPLAGSYYVETLTDKLCEVGWEKFRNIEEHGGCEEWMNDGHLAKALREDQERIWKDVSNRRKTLVGINNYPNSMENPSLDELTDGFRYGSKFEELRHHVYQSVKSGKLKKMPEVQPLKVGNSAAMITARLNFGVNFLGCAGYKVLKETNSESLSETTAEMILICGSDDDYTGLNQSQIDEWRQKAQLVILAGNPPNADELKAMGIDAFIHVKSDVLETNKSILKMLTLV